MNKSNDTTPAVEMPGDLNSYIKEVEASIADYRVTNPVKARLMVKRLRKLKKAQQLRSKS